MPTVSVHLTEEESRLVRDYCASHGVSLSSAFKSALLERIEDEFDLAEYEAARKRIEGDQITHSLEEVSSQLGIK